MIKTLDQIDPQWAWEPYSPNRQRPWTRRLVAHLYRRAGFGASMKTLDQAVQRAPHELVEQMAQGGGETAAFQQDMSALARNVLAGGEAKNLAAWWLYRIVGPSDSLREKMTLFWHGHFATGAEKVQDAQLMFAQNQLLRRHALGDFAAMVQGVSRDPAMLIYLDSANNRKAHPNENYARELMELFCLGEGNYTEDDIRQLARCFTGWEIRRGKFRFNRYQHDAGEKSFLGATGKLGGEDAVKVVLRQQAAPRFIAGKLFQYFICDEPSPPEKLLEPLADQFREDQLQIGPLVRRILSSNLFYSEMVIARKVRSPIDVGVGLLEALEGSTNVNALAEDLTQLGHALFFPPNVKGWEGGRTWINSSTLLSRANMVRRLVTSEKTRFAGGNLASLLDKYQIKEPQETIAWLCELLLAAPPPQAVREQLTTLAANDKLDRNERLVQVVQVIGALPEFQLA